MQLSIPDQFTFPIEIINGVPFMTGTLNGNPATFLIDSASKTTILNANRVAPDQLRVIGQALGVNRELQTAYACKIKQLKFGDLQYESLDVSAVDLSAMEVKWGKQVHGILGFREMIHFDWSIDYQAARFRFWRRFPAKEMQIVHQQVLQYQQYLPMVDLQMGGNTFRFRVDTGEPHINFDKALEFQVRPMIQMGSVPKHTADQSSPSLMEMLPYFELGGLQLGPAPIIFQDHFTVQSQQGHFDGSIGYQLLGKYPAVFSWSSARLWFMGG